MPLMKAASPAYQRELEKAIEKPVDKKYEQELSKPPLYGSQGKLSSNSDREKL